MRQVIELIRKHPKMCRILRCESPYFHHWYTMLVMHNYALNRKFKCLQYIQLARMIAVPFARTNISHTNVY